MYDPWNLGGLNPSFFVIWGGLAPPSPYVEPPLPTPLALCNLHTCHLVNGYRLYILRVCDIYTICITQNEVILLANCCCILIGLPSGIPRNFQQGVRIQAFTKLLQNAQVNDSIDN